jgi:hypothetical protein
LKTNQNDSYIIKDLEEARKELLETKKDKNEMEFKIFKLEMQIKD